MECGTGIKVLWYRARKKTNTALRKTIRPKPASNEMLAPWGNPVKTAGGNGTKKPLNTSVRNNTLQGPS